MMNRIIVVPLNFSVSFSKLKLMLSLRLLDVFKKHVYDCQNYFFDLQTRLVIIINNVIDINDVYADLKNADNGGEITGISINHICFFLLLFADDMILFTKTPTELQTLLNMLQKYSTEWGLRVNTKKTKICVFENRRSQQNQLWCYDGEPLDIVDSFCYLGMKFHKNGNLEPGVPYSV